MLCISLINTRIRQLLLYEQSIYLVLDKPMQLMMGFEPGFKPMELWALGTWSKPVGPMGLCT